MDKLTDYNKGDYPESSACKCRSGVLVYDGNHLGNHSTHLHEFCISTQ